MKIFKNRGDIYIPKSKRASKQAKILYILLAFIVCFTVVFVGYLHKNYATAADFFARGEVTTTKEAQEIEEMPEISGKTNFLVLETDEDKKSIHYVFLIQTDRDNKAYKAASLSPDMRIGNNTIQSLYTSGGASELKSALTSYFGFIIDYYVDFDSESFTEFINKLGSFVYASTEDIDYNGNKENDKYSLKIKEGEQSVNGSQVSNLLRYYTQVTKNYSAENELILTGVSELFNKDNYENENELFKLFMKNCKTDITVRDFENGKNGVMVFCEQNTDITLYSAKTAYDKTNTLTSDSIKDIKGYFTK